MGTVERYWKDITIYNVEFVSQAEIGLKRKHRKILAFSSSLNKEDVYRLLPIYLNNIEEILHVDELDEGLLFKNIRK